MQQVIHSPKILDLKAYDNDVNNQTIRKGEAIVNYLNHPTTNFLFIRLDYLGSPP